MDYNEGPDSKEIQERSEMLWKLFNGMNSERKFNDTFFKNQIEKLNLGYRLVAPFPMKWGGTGMNPYEPKKPRNFCNFKRLAKNKSKTAEEVSREYDKEWWQFNLFKSGWWFAFVSDQCGTNTNKLPVDLWRMIKEFIGHEKIRNPGCAYGWDGYMHV
jgi:hypothetical protein